MIYWDTSCVIKLYTQESDSTSWQALAMREKEGLLSSALLSAELGLALAHKEARGDLRPGGAVRLHASFLRDARSGRFQLMPVGEDVLQRAVQIAARCLQATPRITVRTLDGIHLATAVLMRCSALATADSRMAQAASLLGLSPAKPN